MEYSIYIPSNNICERDEVTIQNYEGKTFLGIDYGHKKSGLASFRWGIDPCPTPYETVFEADLTKLCHYIWEVIDNECIDIIILGLPTHADGSDSDSTKRVRRFADKLIKEKSIEIIYQDEHLTSFEAKERIKDSKLGQFEEGYVDKLAASIILEDFIQKTKNPNS